ncbi:hypothetical protein MP638_006240 [Amoeboaphelidium occidentale]|nr:hypothetical protein MP638_006240 [Amoeboaphelidium occidentale]
MSLPREILDIICTYLPFEKAIYLASPFALRLQEGYIIFGTFSQMSLPREILDHIFTYLPFEKAIYLASPTALRLQYEQETLKPTIDRAAADGHLAVVEWLHQHRTEGCTTNAMDEAAQRGHVDIANYLPNVLVRR